MSVSVQGKKVGNFTVVFGEWSHVLGAAQETLQVGGRVMGALFQHLDDDEPHEVEVPYTVSQDTVTGVSTITIHCNAQVTTGRFMVFVI